MSDLFLSSIVKSQVPSFVREDYPKFVTFLEKYYEWLKTNNQVLDAVQKFAASKDLDLSDDFYLDLIKKELMPYFPEEILLEKSRLVKFINEYYRSKGTPQSLKFLFKILYNEEIDVYYPKEDILKASDGKWFLPLSLRLDTEDNNIFNLVGVKIVGENSKSTAIVETVTRSIDRQLGIEYVELFISNITKLFETGEIISGTYTDEDGNEVTASGRLIGSLSELKIRPEFRGLFYNGYDTTTGYQGDPVSIVGGLNPTPPSGLTPIGAIATVGDTTKGSITQIVVNNGGFGFRDPLIEKTHLIDFVGGFENSLLGQETRAKIELVNPDQNRVVNVSNVEIEFIYSLTLDGAANTGNIENCQINFVTTTQSLNVFPITYISTDGSGGGYRSLPDVNFYSFYLEELDDSLIIESTAAVKGTNILSDFNQDLTLSFEPGNLVRLFLRNRFEEIRTVRSVSTNSIILEGDPFENDITGLSVFKIFRRPLNDVGALGRIEIVDGGENYNVGDYLIFTGGTGYGANAQITEVHLANNGIKSVEFNDDGSIIKGGEGYTKDGLPVITIDTTTGSNSVLRVTEILGQGVDVDLFSSRIGAITSLRIVSYGYDYVTSPTISLRNADLTVSNVTEGQLFVSNTIVYQGQSNSNTSFSATVEKFTPSTGILRVFNYKGSINTQIQLLSDTEPAVNANVVSVVFYGDGKAQATAEFENGLIRYPGVYLNTDGQPSSDKKLQDARKYHNFSYLISTENDYNKFKKSLNEIVHPLGTKAFVNRVNTKDNDAANSEMTSIHITEETLSNTFNIVSGSNSMIAVGASSDLANIVNVGDTLILTNLYKSVNGTVNITSSSNVVTGNNTNFINDLQDGDEIYISSGNTSVITLVSNSSSLIVRSVLNVSSNLNTINLIYNDARTVTFVNANTILVSGIFDVTANSVTTILQKVE